MDTDRCYLCEEPFVKKTTLQRFCSHRCADQFNRLKDVTELFRLTPEEKELRLKLLVKLGVKNEKKK